MYCYICCVTSSKTFLAICYDHFGVVCLSPGWQTCLWWLLRCRLEFASLSCSWVWLGLHCQQFQLLTSFALICNSSFSNFLDLLDLKKHLLFSSVIFQPFYCIVIMTHRPLLLLHRCYRAICRKGRGFLRLCDFGPYKLILVVYDAIWIRYSYTLRKASVFRFRLLPLWSFPLSFAFSNWRCSLCWFQFTFVWLGIRRA